MRCKVFILNSVCIAVMLLSFTVFASAESPKGNLLYSVSSFELSDEVKDVLKSVGLKDFSAEEISNISISDTFNMIMDVFKGSLQRPFACMCTLLGIIILCSVVRSFLHQEKGISVYFESMITLFVALAAFTSAVECISDCVASMYSAGILMKSLIPVTAVLVAIAGAPAMAVSYNAVAMYCAQIISAICRDFLTPILCVFASVSVCASVNSSINFESLLNASKKIISILLGLAGTVFTGIIALKDVLAVGIDKVAMKGVKFVLGSAVPVVGSSLSEGLSSIIASVSLMKNTYGTIGIIVVVCVTLPAVCELILWMLTFSVTTYAAQALGLSGISKALSSLQYVMSMLLAVLLFTIYILIVTAAMVILLGNK